MVLKLLLQHLSKVNEYILSVKLMAYSSTNRFPQSQKYYKLLDPGAYQDGESKLLSNKVPFLSNTPRNTQAGGRIWTHAIYHADLRPKVPNCTSLISKSPRFSYEAYSKEDLADILCRCGEQIPCECFTEVQKQEKGLKYCQAKVRRCIFKGPSPKSVVGEGLLAACKRDHRLELLPDGPQNKIRNNVTGESTPFYDIKVNKSTCFYHGCKWSHWTSKRALKYLEVRPGPADYNLERELTHAEVSAEKFRSYRRKTSKQLRFIEMVQRSDILANNPGPANYSPKNLKGSNLQYLGPKANRFPVSKHDDRPGPADCWLQRDFDSPIPPESSCHAKLPEPAFFGIKAQRFKPSKEEGPSPATYSPNYKSCQFMQCSTAPFGSLSKRSKDELNGNVDQELLVQKVVVHEDNEITNRYSTPTWEFRSKTIRMKDLLKKLKESSPADIPQPRVKVKRSPQLQYNAPFFSSEGRFEPWNDWLPVHGKQKTPGCCYYSLEKGKCLPAVHRGPLCRSPRFLSSTFQTPAPNIYKIGGGIETVLATHNQRLRNNIENQHKFIWEPPVEPRKLSFEELETLLLNRSIALLEIGDSLEVNTKKSISGKSTTYVEPINKPKLLRCFLYNHQMPHCT